MNKICKKAICGNAGQNADCVVEILPNKSGVDISIDSLVESQYGNAIKNTVIEQLEKFSIKDAKVIITDRGAIDPVLRARVECAIIRGIGDSNA